MYIKDAYYSTKCAEAFGHAIYKTVEGKEIAVTEVIKEGKSPVSSNWKDLNFVGKVNEYIKTIDDGYDSHLLDDDDHFNYYDDHFSHDDYWDDEY